MWAISMNPIVSVWNVLKGAWWWLGGVVGDHDYDNYVRHLSAHHPEAEIPSKKEYWRARYDNQENNPASRCC